MHSLIIQQTETTPNIIFEPEKNIFKISGESRPENAKAFYEPIIEWMKEFCAETIKEQRKEKIVFTVFFEYFSSSTAKYIMNILSRLEELQGCKIPVEIKWVFNDLDIEMKEAGEEFQKVLNLPFKFEIVN